MKAITFSLAMVLFLAVLSQAAVSPEVVQAASGTYTGRQLGVRGGQFVTLILSPDGRATISLAPVPGGQAVYSRGVWRMVTSDFIRVNVGGMAGTGILEFQRFDGQLRLTRNDVGLRSDFPLQLYQQPSIAGTYTAISSSSGFLRTLTLQLDPGGTASLVVNQTSPQAPPVSWTGTWQQTHSGDIVVSISNAGQSERLIFSRADGTLRASAWNQSMWGWSAPVFTRAPGS